MDPINVLYISIEGNTRSFMERLMTYANQQHAIDNAHPEIKAREITEQSDFTDEREPFFASVPTYLDGGNGIDSGVKELMTNVLGEYIRYHNNARLCIGVIGSGNRNFNEQYCLTAKRYARQFNAPFIADYELRGTSNDIERIYKILIEQTQAQTN
ncbi:NrdI family ribonucleotide reductase [Paucilactobacillus hokkaidonensis JCM 18461]|uniref:NrdI family ribonucleotide reductase n=2 Tax=Paucilactobacillus hokkaidonensis TaxID=1193095 RepID=A0A0A1GWX9_9LACO|nr:class Ib ribonucleoside-diphosphate reductase assembly flavoprotein NrdI [Paucilactobacillus hokkaidonensis]KRO08184.1 NrdI family protein [Paucilactobacillus hokkaidonensis]BAP86575.1 NrdI family ribonucleotide reductase [Paucilactobacillus hokkaidonensis JCM 18461]